MFLVSVVFAVILVGTMLAFAGRFALAPFLLFWGVWMATFLTYILIESVRSAHHVKRIRADTESAEPNDAPLRLALNALAVGYRDWVFRSRATLLGYPLIDINVGNPAAPSGTGGPGSPPAGRRIARGWIAIGDDARGLLVGMGGIARGLIAIGGIAIGGVAIGGCSLVLWRLAAWPSAGKLGAESRSPGILPLVASRSPGMRLSAGLRSLTITQSAEQPGPDSPTIIQPGLWSSITLFCEGVSPPKLRLRCRK